MSLSSKRPCSHQSALQPCNSYREVVESHAFVLMPNDMKKEDTKNYHAKFLYPSKKITAREDTDKTVLNFKHKHE